MNGNKNKRSRAPLSSSYESESQLSYREKRPCGMASRKESPLYHTTDDDDHNSRRRRQSISNDKRQYSRRHSRVEDYHHQRSNSYCRYNNNNGGYDVHYYNKNHHYRHHHPRYSSGRRSDWSSSVRKKPRHSNSPYYRSPCYNAAAEYNQNKYDTNPAVYLSQTSNHSYYSSDRRKRRPKSNASNSFSYGTKKRHYVSPSSREEVVRDIYRHRYRRSRRPSRWRRPRKSKERRRSVLLDHHHWTYENKQNCCCCENNNKYKKSYYNHYREKKLSYTRESDSLQSYPAEVKNEKKSDDEIIHFDWRAGMELGRRYVVKSQLGEGTFGRVLECLDRQSKKNVAIKVVRDISRYTSAAKIEAEILEEVRERDPERKSNCVILHERFLFDQTKSRICRSQSAYSRRRKSSNQSHKKIQRSSSTDTSDDGHGPGIHMCLVSEKLGLSLFAYLSQNKYRGFFVKDIRSITREVLRALCFLNSIKLTHTDLKPENILFVHRETERVLFPRSQFNSRFWDGDASDSDGSDDTIRTFSHPIKTERPLNCQVKLIDFGSATFEGDTHCSLINTRQYRAPEVILQIGWSMPSDMWSLGCILMELYTGILLFRTHEHLEHLGLMIVGPIPDNVLEAASKTDGAKYLVSKGDRFRLDWPAGATSQKSIDKVANSRRLEGLVLPVHRLFAEFVRFLLEIDPARRPTPEEALQHPFMHTRLPEI